LRFLQGWAAMLRVVFDFAVDTSNPLGTGISDSRPSQKTKERGTHCVGNASEIKSRATRQNEIP